MTEFLTQQYFLALEETRRILEGCRADYNNDRCHGGFNQTSTAQFRAS